MFKLRKANVLISGLGGVGVEIAKNLILGGIRNVTLHDTKTTTWHDLSSQYYLSEEDLGRNRAEACFQKLAELNDSVACDCVVKELTEEYVSKFDVSLLLDIAFY
jgi:ubiquitin-activating enzyme E1